MAKSDMIELEGTVVEALPNTTFRVVSFCGVMKNLRSPQNAKRLPAKADSQFH